MPKYKEGKQTQPIELPKMIEIIEDRRRFKQGSHRSFLAFLYLTGVRQSEARARVRDDFVLEKDAVMIHIPALKHGTREHLKLPLDLPFMDLILERLDDTPRGKKLWRFSARTAQRIIKRAMGEKYYPHFLRLNRSVHFLDDPETTIPQMQAWFGWRSARTIDSYTGYSKRHLDAQAERLKSRI